MLESNVFKRQETNAKLIGPSLYNLLIGLTLCWGFAVNYFIVKTVDTQALLQIHFLVFIIGYFASCMFGVFLYSKSDQPIISFIGYNFVVVPFGLMVNLVVSQYDDALILEAVKVTGLVTGSMMLLGTLFPAFFRKVIGALSIALIVVIIIEVVQVFFFKMHSNWIDWAIAAIFCGYIGYDWGRANQIPKTVDNAIDSAAALYMDIINLFIRILRIMGRRN